MTWGFSRVMGKGSCSSAAKLSRGERVPLVRIMQRTCAAQQTSHSCTLQHPCTAQALAAADESISSVRNSLLVAEVCLT